MTLAEVRGDAPPVTEERLRLLRELERKVLWLSS